MENLALLLLGVPLLSVALDYLIYPPASVTTLLIRSRTLQQPLSDESIKSRLAELWTEVRTCQDKRAYVWDCWRTWKDPELTATLRSKFAQHLAEVREIPKYDAIIAITRAAYNFLVPLAEQLGKQVLLLPNDKDVLAKNARVVLFGVSLNSGETMHNAIVCAKGLGYTPVSLWTLLFNDLFPEEDACDVWRKCFKPNFDNKSQGKVVWLYGGSEIVEFLDESALNATREEEKRIVNDVVRTELVSSS